MAVFYFSYSVIISVMVCLFLPLLSAVLYQKIIIESVTWELWPLVAHLHEGGDKIP